MYSCVTVNVIVDVTC